jgi:hypothetical protein
MGPIELIHQEASNTINVENVQWDQSFYQRHTGNVRLPKFNAARHMTPFSTNTTREDRQGWFAHTPPWDQVASSVIDAILDGITNKALLEAFVVASMEQNLVPRYESLGRQSTPPDIIRAQVSHILCLTGNQAIALLAKALQTNDTDNARRAYQLAMNAFEPAIALAKNQIVAYAGISAAYGMVSKRSESHEYAKRGLAELAEMRRLAPNVDLNRVLPPEALDQMEQHLRSLLAW